MLLPPQQEIPVHYVFVMFIGGNDMTDSMLEGMDMDTFQENFTANFTASAELLVNAGAKHVLVFGLPIPERAHNLVTAQFKESVHRINLAAADTTRRLKSRHNDVSVHFVDMESIANDIAQEYIDEGKMVR